MSDEALRVLKRTANRLNKIVPTTYKTRRIHRERIGSETGLFNVVTLVGHACSTHYSKPADRLVCLLWLVEVLDRFFVSVLVNCKDEVDYHNRMTLLWCAQQYFNRFADFSKLEITNA